MIDLGPRQQSSGLGTALHRDARGEEHQVNDCVTAAGMRPVHHHDAVAGEQQVVGPDVGVEQGVARGVGRPRGFQGG